MRRCAIAVMTVLVSLGLAAWGVISADPRFDSRGQPGDGGLSREIRSRESGTRETGADHRIYKALQKRLTLTFKEVPLTDAVKELSFRTDVNFFLDAQGLEAEGVSPKTPVSAVANGTRLCTLLDQILEPLHLDYAIANEVLKVTSRVQARGGVIAVTYPVKSLTAPLPDGQPGIDGVSLKEFVQKLQSRVRPETWKAAGGPGVIQWQSKSASFKIIQTPDVHDAIQEFMARLENRALPASHTVPADPQPARSTKKKRAPR